MPAPKELISGFTNTIGGVAAFSGSRSITKSCLCTPTWGAAKPMPWAVYMLRSMSRAKSRTDSSTLLMRLADWRSTPFPKVWISIGETSSATFGT